MYDFCGVGEYSSNGYDFEDFGDDGVFLGDGVFLYYSVCDYFVGDGVCGCEVKYPVCPNDGD